MRVGRIIVFIALATLTAACGRGTRPGSAPPSAGADSASAGPASPDTASEPLVMGMTLLWRRVDVCVADSAGMRRVSAMYNMRTGDTLVDDRPFTEVYPPTEAHAATQRWYVDNELIPFGGRRYVKLGTPVWPAPGAIVRIGAYRGVPVFRDADDASDRPDGIYVLVRPSCEFHFYDLDLSVHGVRG